MVPVAIAFFAALTCTTAVSLSLEGSMYPMLKSWPLDPMTLFYAKILVNLTLLIPAILISVPLVMLTIPLTWYYFFFALLIPVLASIAIAQAGIVINLQFPKFDWTSHVSVVKQSIATMIAIFVVWG
jgi:ABC-2 type transport system permease protein